MAGAGALAAWMLGTIVALPRRDVVPDPAPQMVIALGSGVTNDTLLDHAGSTRLASAIAYARAHHARIVTTRVHNDDGLSSDNAQRFAIARAGLGKSWLLLSARVNNTHDEALALRAELTDSTPIALITSPLHTRRACAAFEKVGFRVTCVASAQYRWWFVPYAVIYETAAAFKYKLAGWW